MWHDQHSHRQAAASEGVIHLYHAAQHSTAASLARIAVASAAANAAARAVAAAAAVGIAAAAAAAAVPSNRSA